jgi:hypothetical protein
LGTPCGVWMYDSRDGLNTSVSGWSGGDNGT